MRLPAINVDVLVELLPDAWRCRLSRPRGYELAVVIGEPIRDRAEARRYVR